jgi:hypothetical protein
MSVEDKISAKMGKLCVIFTAELRQIAGAGSVDGIGEVSFVLALIDAGMGRAVQYQGGVMGLEKARNLGGIGDVTVRTPRERGLYATGAQKLVQFVREHSTRAGDDN